MHDQPTTLPATEKTAQSEPVALFVSDLHLQEALPRTTQAFFAFLRNHAMKARQLYVLGDLFEYWAGDDDIATPCNRQVADAIRQVSDAGVSVFWIAGNRDFLAGDGFAHATGATPLPDPFIATIAGQRIVLTHGDAQCTDDAAYMAFRAQVRQPGWQQAFLAQPLAQRKKIIEGVRSESRRAQHNKSYDIMDVNTGAIASLFDATDSSIMIHGHTHRPARHENRDGAGTRIRYVLPDWDCDVEPARGGWVAIGSDGVIRRYAIDGIELQ
ncbi:MAG TPA: UDP-2,3-diacylglucosamine diphosphatase [Burkholderiaceae bacterium]|nr:UDP-2,3-diacylglucosamine diphosphatase [Burkholderiaceae bacterium]